MYININLCYTYSTYINYFKSWTKMLFTTLKCDERDIEQMRIVSNNLLNIQYLIFFYVLNTGFLFKAE